MTLHSISRACAIAVCVGLAAGCARSTLTNAIPNTAGHLAPAAARQLSQDPVSAVFVAEYGSSVDSAAVRIFNASGTQTGRITSLRSVGGLAVDASANLWVTDPQAYRIYEYSPPYTKRALTILDTDGQPRSIAVNTNAGPRSGYVAVASFPTGGGYASMSLYPPGSTRPCRTVGNRFIQSGWPMGFDAGGNVVLFGAGGKPGAIWRGGCGTPQIEKLYVDNWSKLQGPTAFRPAPNNQYGLLDAEYANGFTGTLFLYSAPVKAHLQSVASMKLMQNADPSDFEFTKGGNDVWVSYFYYGLVEYAYPGGTPVVTINDTAMSGPIAIAPAFTP